MIITVSRRTPGQAHDKIPEATAVAWPDSLTHRRTTVAATVASGPGRPFRERPPHAKADRS